MASDDFDNDDIVSIVPIHRWFILPEQTSGRAQDNASGARPDQTGVGGRQVRPHQN